MKVTLQQVIDSKPDLIFYSTNTIWWTHDPKDLRKGPVPLDIFGSPLFQSKDIENFLSIKNIEECTVYGHPANRLRNFMMMQHSNLDELFEKFPTLSGKKDLMVGTSAFSKWLDENLSEDNKIPKEAPVESV